MVTDMRSRMSLYVVGLSCQSRKEGKKAMLIRDVDPARFTIHVKQVKEDKLKDREEFKNKRAKTSKDEFRQQKSDANRSSLPQKQKGPALPSATAPAPKNKSEYNSNSYSFRAKPVYPQGSMVPRGSKAPACARCGRKHQGNCRYGQTSCFKCGQKGHFMRECPEIIQGNGNRGNKAQPSLIDPPNRVAPQGDTSGTGRETNPFFASCQEQKDSLDVVNGIIEVFDFTIYALLDLEASSSDSK
ncbi:uncharacterized protein LOC125847209 [Solanum stenotomum]|uniref:uncharacterized protein LOC125847209 n=1 Tax=Solanum stenotomum TaxID=172797 RepID=UPI0020D05D13|nr:uncharacterized protein LOC125847209 [Solanum stenotomum]